MSIGIAEARPPYVVFEYQAFEDREASIAAGHYVAKDIAMAIITPQGSRDRIMRNAEEWLSHITTQAAEGRFPDTWVQGFKERFAAFLRDETLPESGTPVSSWPAVSPAQLKALKTAGVRTVEDLAGANEESLSRIGMGARALKTLASNWLASAASTGQIAGKITALESANADLSEANAKLQKQVQELLSRIPDAPKPRPL